MTVLQKTSPSHHRQAGATLVVTLILLLVMTVLGVASMHTTTLEERMASNSQEFSRAFHAAETGLTGALLTMLPSNSLSDLIRTTTSSGTTKLKNDSAGTTNAGALFSSTYLDSGAPPAGSGSEENMDGSYAAYYFNVQSAGGNVMTFDATNTATSTASNANASVTLNQGAWRLGPSLK